MSMCLAFLNSRAHVLLRASCYHFEKKALSLKWETMGAGLKGHMQAADGPNRTV